MKRNGRMPNMPMVFVFKGEYELNLVIKCNQPLARFVNPNFENNVVSACPKRIG
jgi:hypothetical protein